MSRIRGTDTGPEIAVRCIAHALGLRFRLHKKDLPGRPDLVFPRHRKVIFVHGCFWHGHSCRYGRPVPKTNRRFWKEKIEKNQARDRRVIRELRALGWSSIIVWECQLKKPERVSTRISKSFDMERK